MQFEDVPQKSGMTITHTLKDGSSVTHTWEEYQAYQRPHTLLWDKEDPLWAQRIPKDFRFEVGKKYLTLGGKIITIIKEHNEPGYETVQGDDCGPEGLSGWRYNRANDQGRATGSTWDAENNLIPFEIKDTI